MCGRKLTKLVLCKKVKKPYLLAIFAIIIVSVVVLTILFYTVWYPINYKNITVKYSRQYGLEPNLVSSVICVESKFDAKAVSPKGACGLMQLLPSTAMEVAHKLNEDYSAIDLFDVDTNIRYGCFYLNYLYGIYADTVCVLAAYNAGLGNVNSWLADNKYSEDGVHLTYIPFKETREYVSKVVRGRSVYKMYY